MKLQNITQLRDKMLDILDQQLNGEMDNKEALSVARTASTIVATCKVQVEYKKVTGDPKRIRFLESE